MVNVTTRWRAPGTLATSLGLATALAAMPVEAAEGDPHGGTFTLEEATAGLPSEGILTATIETTKGTLTCRLFEAEAPVTVANFVGLARGVRAFRNPRTRTWVQQPYYDGLVFHRVIPGFMVQTGDFSGSGAGEAGYRIPNEIAPKLKFNRGGMLGMANRGPDTGSAQFFITEAPATHLNGGYTLFGACDGVEVVKAIARVQRDMNDRPRDPDKVVKITIDRVPATSKGKAKGKAKDTIRAAGKAQKPRAQGEPAAPAK